MSILIYLCLGAWLVVLSRDQINPDGVAYIQHARHWAAGRLDLAITTWWGPLLSWLLVPAVWLHIEPAIAAKILGVVLGLLTALGASRIATSLTRAWNGEPSDGRPGTHGAVTLLVFVSTLAMVLTMLPEPVTPDLLLTCILTRYFAFTLDWLRTGNLTSILLAGALGGLGYLAKSYALPFVVIHLAGTALLRRRAIRRGQAQGAWFRPVLHAMTLAAVVVLPWVVTISRHDAKPTIGCAGQYARRAFDPVSFMDGYPKLPIFDIQQPREGRLTCWENGLEAPRAWDDWPVTSVAGVRRIAYDTFLNFQRSLRYLESADKLGLMRISLLVMVVALLAWPRRLPPLAPWTLLSVLLFYAGYLPLIVYDRYLWPAWPLQLTLVLALLVGRPRDDQNGRARLSLGLLVSRWSLAIAMLISLGWMAGITIDKWRGPSGQGALYSTIRQAGQAGAQTATCFVANEWHQGLFCAYWGDRQYLGQFDGRDAQDIAQQLRGCGNVAIVIFDDPKLVRDMLASKRFALMNEAAVPPAGPVRIQVLRRQD